MIHSKRIPIILKIFKDDKLKSRFIKSIYPYMSKKNVGKYVIEWCDNENRIEKVWKSNPELKLIEVLYLTKSLINLNYIWETSEEYWFLINNQIKESRELLIFQTLHQDTVEYSLVKDMKTKDIKNIIVDVINETSCVSIEEEETLWEELTYRGEADQFDKELDKKIYNLKK